MKLLLLAALVACSGELPIDPGEPEPEPPANDPILFVHGYGRTPADWNDMIARFRADGWTDRELHRLGYGFTQSNTEVATAIRDSVNAITARTGATRMDIVAHSMGSLSSRYYLRNLGGEGRIDAWVSIAGPNHGTRTAASCGAFAACQEMSISSSFLTALNAGDETPGAVRYATWWSPCDAIIDPVTSVVLTGATNTQTQCLGHGQLLTDASVYAQVRNWVKGN